MDADSQPTFDDIDLSGATDAERESARLAEETAFAESFGDTAREVAQGDKPSPAPSEAPAPGPVPAPKPAPTPAAPAAPAVAADDPFASLPEAVRQVLAAVPTIEREVKETKGRVSTLQRENDQLRRDLASRAAPAAPAPGPSAAAPTPPADLPSLAVVRKELPEVATAIEDYVRDALGKKGSAADAPAAPAPAAPSPPAASPAPADPEEQALNDYDEQWAVKLHSTDFKLWLATQPEAERDKIMSTDKSAVIVGALTRFDKQRAARTPAPPPEDAATKRAGRAAAAVQPRGAGGAAAASPAQATAEDAFLSGFTDG